MNNNILTSGELIDELVSRGTNFFCGVPDSVLRAVIRLIQERGLSYVPATCEDVAVGMGVGAYLAGKKPCMVFQNSGLGNAADAIMTLNVLYKIPFLFLVAWRGFDGKDEVQHLDWGKITFPFLEAIQMPGFLIERENYKGEIEKALRIGEQEKTSAALIMRRGYLDETR
ncbi:MAG: thiamine pyrophosphate-binding protein [Patescibacteria group bacterium]